MNERRRRAIINAARGRQAKMARLREAEKRVIWDNWFIEDLNQKIQFQVTLGKKLEALWARMQ